MRLDVLVGALVLAFGIGCGGTSGADDASLDATGEGVADLDAVPSDAAFEARDASDDALAPALRLYSNDGGVLRDARGRALVLRGVNYPADDVAYWADKPAGWADDFAFLAASGFDVLRLVINWDRLEPEPDAYDAAYLDLVAAQAADAVAAGLYVVIDLHQDLFGLGFGLHGAPRWACDEALYASFTPVEPWFSNYFSTEVSACFTRFWTDLDLQGHHARAAARLAERLVGNDGVLGFDPWNEPFPGTLSHAVFERDHLGPFYQRFMAGIDAVCPGRLLFFEPSVLISVYKQTTFASPAAPLQAVFFPHYYNFSVETTKHWDGRIEVDRAWVDAAAGEAARLGVPWGIGELGGDMTTPNLDAYLYGLYDLLDGAQAGSFLWIFTKGTGGFGLVDATTGKWISHARAFLRPAPALVAGTPLAWSWDPVDGVFELTWDEDAAAGDTELLVPAWAAEVGFTLEVDGAEVEPPTLTPAHRLAVAGGKGGARSVRLTVLGPYPE